MYEEFPHHVVFEKKEKTDDGLGGSIEEWVEHYSTSAHVQPISGYTRIVAQAQETPITTRVYFPYTDTILPPSLVRIRFGANILTPESDPIDQGGMGEKLMMQCRE